MIVNSVHFDLNYSSNQAKLFSKLETISDMLDEAAATDPLGLNLRKVGRRHLKKVYTGKEYTMVHPIMGGI